MGRNAKAAAIAVIAASALACGTAAGSDLPGAKALKVCAAAGPRRPTMTLAIDGASAWIACKERSRVIRVNTKNGKTTKSVRLNGPPIAVRSAFGSIWALDEGGTLQRLNPRTGKIARRISLRVTAAYNVWIGGGSVWVADDQGASVVRVSPLTNRVVARIAVGDGRAAMRG